MIAVLIMKIPEEHIDNSKETKTIKLEKKDINNLTQIDYENIYNYDFRLSPDGVIYIFEKDESLDKLTSHHKKTTTNHNKAASQIKDGSSTEDLEAAGWVRGSRVARMAEGLLFIHPHNQHLTIQQKYFLYYFILYNRNKPEVSKEKYQDIRKVLNYGWDIIDKAREQMWFSFF